MITNTPKENANTAPSKVLNIAPQYKSQLLTKIIPYKGHALYEVDIDNEVVNIIKPIKSAVVTDVNKHTTSVDNRVETKPNCLYISCLNKKNLIRLILQAGGKDISGFTFNTSIE